MSHNQEKIRPYLDYNQLPLYCDAIKFVKCCENVIMFMQLQKTKVQTI